MNHYMRNFRLSLQISFRCLEIFGFHGCSSAYFFTDQHLWSLDFLRLQIHKIMHDASIIKATLLSLLSNLYANYESQLENVQC